MKTLYKGIMYKYDRNTQSGLAFATRQEVIEK